MSNFAIFMKAEKGMEKKRFLNFLQFEKRFSTHTLLAYTHDLDIFIHF